MVRIAQALVIASLVFCAACGVPFNQDPKPLVLTHLDIARKHDYILNTKSTLKVFRTSVGDLRNRNRPAAMRELAQRFDDFVVLQVRPIIGDWEAENNLATQLELAKLRLLCGLIYVDFAETQKAKELLDEMKEYYGDNPGIMRAPLDRGDIGVTSLEGGLQLLEQRVAGLTS
jgi:hypothetical protein